MTIPNTSPSATEPRPFKSDAAVIEDVVRRLHEFETHTLERPSAGSALIAVVPEGKKLQDLKAILDSYLEKPERRKGTARFFDVDSFIEFIRRFEGEGSAVFGDPNRLGPKFTAVIDYHPRGEDADQADWLQHRGVYEPQLSAEWQVWAANNGKLLPQADFAALIEDRIIDLVVPDVNDEKIKAFADVVGGRWAMPSDVHELSRNLSINVEIGVRNAITLQSGEISVVYDEQHKDGEGQQIRVPNLFQLVIPVFYAGVAYRMAARLRYRLGAGGKLSWMYQLVRPDLVFDDAFRGIITKIDETTRSKVFLGTPEQP